MGIDLDNSLVSLRCSICNETYQQPHILACLHSFCYSCIEKLGRTGDEQNNIKCPRCNVESCLTEGTVRPNYFVANALAASLLKELRDGNVCCGNCSKEKPPTVFCEECREHLCSECVYCHQNTKVTRSHRLIPRQEYEARLAICGNERAVFCLAHTDCKVEEYCRSCQETTCRGCDCHLGHSVVSLAKAYSMETPVLEEVLYKAAATVDAHERCASRCCGIVDELRSCKGQLSDRIRTYFTEYRERIQKYEERLLEMVVLWYDRKFKMIKQAQQEEELRIEKVGITSLFNPGTKAPVWCWLLIVQDVCIKFQ